MSAKLEKLQDQVDFNEKQRSDLRERLLKSEDANKELINFIKNLQSQNDKEMSSIRQFMQQKLSEENVTSAKNNEKSSVLFNELVRLGKENERYASRVEDLK